jgi:uncharacterized LabA/DUF88 family protein
MNTYVYVDGFNLYYGAVKGTPYKWLNISELCQRLLPRNNILEIKYFTALISGRPGDPDQPNRQQIYLRALRTIPNLKIIYGHFFEHPRYMPLVSSLAGKIEYAYVMRTEEKGSDVNLAAHLINDGYKGLYQVAVLITNDSDLVEPIKIIRNELNLAVGVLNPHQGNPSYELNKCASFTKPIRKGVLKASQFPTTLTDPVGNFHKPPKW